MKKIVLIALIATNAIYTFAQRTVGIKIYQNTDIFDSHYNESGVAEPKKVENVNFGRFSLALNIETKESLVHEIEVLIPEVSRPVGKVQFPMNYEFLKSPNHDGKVSSYSVRYELSKALTDQEQRFSFLLGAGINPYFVNIEYEPNNQTSYYSSKQAVWFRIEPYSESKIQTQSTI